MPDPAPRERITERSTDSSFKDRAVAAIAEPRLVVFHPAHASGASVLLMPGGGYRHVVVDKEGYEMGRWLAARGITAFVLFYRLPGDTPERETALEPGDLIVAVHLPDPPAGAQAYRKVRDRSSYAFALVSMGAVVSVENGKIASAAMAFGGLGPRPWRDHDAESVLEGETPSRALFDKAADVLLADAKGQGENDFKIPLTRRVVAAVLSDLTGVSQ